MTHTNEFVVSIGAFITGWMILLTFLVFLLSAKYIREYWGYHE